MLELFALALQYAAAAATLYVLAFAMAGYPCCCTPPTTISCDCCAGTGTTAPVEFAVIVASMTGGAAACDNWNGTWIVPTLSTGPGACNWRYYITGVTLPHGPFGSTDVADFGEITIEMTCAAGGGSGVQVVHVWLRTWKDFGFGLVGTVTAHFQMSRLGLPWPCLDWDSQPLNRVAGTSTCNDSSLTVALTAQ